MDTIALVEFDTGRVVEHLHLGDWARVRYRARRVPPVKLVLQRQLRGDCAKWRTVGRFRLDDLDRVLRLSAELAGCLEPISMRAVREDDNGHQVGSVAEWTGQEWRVTA